MSLVTCGFCGHSGVHTVVLPSSEGQPTRCPECPRCAATDTGQEEQK